MDLKDSGARTTFNTGAIREVLDDKGRCDLLPLKDIAELTQLPPLALIENFIRTGNKNCIREVISWFIKEWYPDTFTAILDLSKHYAAGANKYAERNWEQGLPLHSFVDSGVRHLLKWYRKDTDEPHDRAFLWNMFGILWTMHNFTTPCDLFDLPFGKEPIDDRAADSQSSYTVCSTR